MTDMIICRLCLLNGEATYYDIFETKCTDKIFKLMEIEASFVLHDQINGFSDIFLFSDQRRRSSSQEHMRRMSRTPK